MKKLTSGSRIALISLVVLGLLIFVISTLLWNTTNSIFAPANPAATGKTIPFEIAQGDTTAQIATKLEQKGLIHNTSAFRVWARIKGLDTHLQAGHYDHLSPSMTISQIVDQLLNARPDAISVTIPEGFRIEQIALRFGKAGLNNFNTQDFLKYTMHIDQFPDAGNYPLLQIVPTGNSMEGLLFPATYDIPTKATARDVVNTLLKQMSDIIKQNNLEATAKANNLDLYQAITLASIVEREALFDEDRPGIASVYWNRIYRQNDETVGFLNADPTVQYARDTQNPPQTYWQPLNDSAKNVVPNSQWNTYTNKGLPPSPICSAGLASLKAAASPAHTDYYFFLNKKDGHAVFAKTAAEFQVDEQKYLS